MDSDDALGATIPAIGRLALAYAPAAARQPTLALLALDARLAGLLRRSSEPMLAQLRLAWWRESLDREAAEWPAGEPIFAALQNGWSGHHRDLAPLVDGWEALTAPPPMTAAVVDAFATGKSQACAALARVTGRDTDAPAAAVLGRIWALEDLAMRLSRSDEREAVAALVAAEPRRLPRVGRALRPLRVLAGLARRRREAGEESAASSPQAMLHALRLGLLGL